MKTHAHTLYTIVDHCNGSTIRNTRATHIMEGHEGAHVPEVIAVKQENPEVSGF